ncbi:uncharacterized protein LOC106665867 [Cimex lectularius]|uniref:BESS domain-containing protein n=1 Tax=Cimex lectularius TaxID=79782 RepID=A0A8I6TDY6_CIMLE|nr:uncharacterized protein LOC106665867 [Cimex lectularius]
MLKKGETLEKRSIGKLRTPFSAPENYEPPDSRTTRLRDFLSPSETREVVHRESRAYIKEQDYEENKVLNDSYPEESDSANDGDSMDHLLTDDELSVGCIVAPPEITPAPSSDYIPSVPKLTSRPLQLEKEPKLPVIVHGRTRGNVRVELDQIKKKYNKKLDLATYNAEKKHKEHKKEMKGWSYLLSFLPFFKLEDIQCSSSSLYKEAESESSECLEVFNAQNFKIVPSSKIFHKKVSGIDSEAEDEPMYLDEWSPLDESKSKEDSDKMFLMSVLPLVKQLKPKDNLEFRLEVQKLIKSKLFPASQTDIVQISKSKISTRPPSRQPDSHRDASHNSQTTSHHNQSHRSYHKGELKPKGSKSTHTKEHRHFNDTAI